MVYNGIAGSTVTLTSENVILEFSGIAHSKRKRRASPRTIPLGAIDGVDRPFAPTMGVHYVHLIVRGQPVEQPHTDLNIFATVPAVPVEPFLDALEAAIARAPRVDDFEPDRRQAMPGRGTAGLAPRESPLLDWLQGG
ncbi:hypothetical protein CH275_16065 [Rhodococcus sp. 06-235-1A]|uniref:DUF4429 domain-containing protein n=1 Tax=Rhodococcus sp. 06-235-1A TaxID=2022508 RepID=UPI000B9C442D|nr:hypothetical protein [Rhodococcus sp. 06-235-1A]OZD03905.1 hypothetical protein CH275_16065 [Rhodococcus sp. 06-235-1A]